MTWNNPVIDGTRSVAFNKTPLNQNSGYIETNMQIDHFWDNANSNLDGHHDVVEMPARGSSPTLSADMDGIFYTEDITKQDTTTEKLPFFLNSDGHTSLLGNRVVCNFSVAVGVPTIEYGFNVASVAKSGTGRFTVNYSTALPSRNYGISIQAYLTNNFLIGIIDPTTSYATNVNTGSINILFYDSRNGTGADPERATLVITGG